MSISSPNHPVIELRVAVTTHDYERLVKFYCDGLGLEPAAIWNNGQGQALILNMGKATLELFDEAQADTIDQLEAGQRISGQIRFALQVPDLKTAMERLLAHGATLIHPPVTTPWGDRNVRLQDPDGMQITLFQASDPQEKSKYMKNNNPTSNLEINALLSNLLSSAKSILGDLFVGMYLSGSLAIGDFDDDSDIDFIFIIKDKVSDSQLSALQAMHVRIHNIDSKWATCLEGYYILQHELQHYDANNAWHLYLDNGSSELVVVNDNHKNWVFERFVLQELEIIVEGSETQNLFEPVSPDDLRHTILVELRSWMAELLADPDLLNNRWRQSFVVLSLCRMLHTLQYGKVISKQAAIQWAKKSLDSRWVNLIERAWAERPNPPLKAHMRAEPEDVEATRGFIRYVLELSQQYEKSAQ